MHSASLLPPPARSSAAGQRMHSFARAPHGSTASGPPERRSRPPPAPCLPTRYRSGSWSERGRAARQVLFYCHFPDLLLVQRRSRLRALYRAPLNRIEEATTGAADRLLVNSNFTNGARPPRPLPHKAGARHGRRRSWLRLRQHRSASAASGRPSKGWFPGLLAGFGMLQPGTHRRICPHSCAAATMHTRCPASARPSRPCARAEVFVATFRRLVKRDVLPSVLHPAVRVPSQTDLERVAGGWRERFEPELAAFLEGGPVFLSINRFERKKARRWPRPGGLPGSVWAWVAAAGAGMEQMAERAREAASEGGSRHARQAPACGETGPWPRPGGAGSHENSAPRRRRAPRSPGARAGAGPGGAVAGRAADAAGGREPRGGALPAGAGGRLRRAAGREPGGAAGFARPGRRPGPGGPGARLVPSAARVLMPRPRRSRGALAARGPPERAGARRASPCEAACSGLQTGRGEYVLHKRLAGSAPVGGHLQAFGRCAAPWGARQAEASGAAASQVRFLPSFTEKQREGLFHTARAVVYTPQARLWP